MKVYPIFALIADRPCLVVGGGAVGERKVQELLEAGARVTLVSRELTPALQELVDRGEIRHLPGDFAPAQVEDAVLVVGATDDPQVNARVSAAAQARGIWVNIVDAPELCTFIVPARVRRGPLTVAIGTGGASPALARHLREELEEHFGPEYGPYLTLLGLVREKVLELRRGHPDNAALFHRLVVCPLRQAIRDGDRQKTLQLLESVVGYLIPREVLQELVDQVWDSRPPEEAAH